MQTNELKDDRFYNWITLSKILKDKGFPWSVNTLKSYEKEGILKFRRLPRTGTKGFLGSEIKELIKKFEEMTK